MKLKKGNYVILYQGHTVVLTSVGGKKCKGRCVITGSEYSFDRFAIKEVIDLNKQWNNQP